MKRVRQVFLLPVIILAWGCGTASQDTAPLMQLVFWSGRDIFIADGLAPTKLNEEIHIFDLRASDQGPAGMYRIAAVSSGQDDTLGFIGAFRSRTTKPGSASAFFLHPGKRRLEKSAEIPEADRTHAMAITPGNKAIVFLSPTSEQPAEIESDDRKMRMDVVVYDLMRRQAVHLAPGEAHYFSQVSVRPDGQHVTFDAADGWIKSVNVKTGDVTKLLEGRAPSWSPDGKQLAYRRGEQLFVYDAGRGTSRKIYRRYAWQTGFVEFRSIYWSQNGKYLAVNVDSYSLFPLLFELMECIVIELEAGKVLSVSSKEQMSYWCGPWVRKAGT